MRRVVRGRIVEGGMSGAREHVPVPKMESELELKRRRRRTARSGPGPDLGPGPRRFRGARGFECRLGREAEIIQTALMLCVNDRTVSAE